MPRTKTTDPKHCEGCGALLERKRYGQRLEDFGVFKRRRHCSLKCANREKEHVTVAALRKRALKFRARTCRVCGTTQGVHAHHLDGNVANNVANNIETLCGSCHLKLHWKTRPRKTSTLAGPTASGCWEMGVYRSRCQRPSGFSQSTSRGSDDQNL